MRHKRWSKCVRAFQKRLFFSDSAFAAISPLARRQTAHYLERPSAVRKLIHPAASINLPPVVQAGNKGKKSNGRDEGGDDIDDAMSSVSIDTYGSSLDFPETNNGGSANDGRSGEAGGGEEGSGSKSADDFKEGVEMLTEKRWVCRMAPLGEPNFKRLLVGCCALDVYVVLRSTT